MSTTLTIAEGFAGPLRAAGLDSFGKLMALPAPRGDVTRAVPGRFTTRVEAAGCVFYLKRHHGLMTAWQARNEWQRLHELRAAGIACPTPVAFGEQRGLFGAGASFVITEEIPSATQADWWLRDRPARRRELLAPIADLARRFHGLGYCHKDFYLCHFFVQETAGAPGELEIFLLDLQRCARPCCCAGRWQVKDLAQLHYSMTAQSGCTADDWREFARLYGATDAALLRAVEAKSARIAGHVPKHG
ncbi:MAG: hypothetical protein HZA91_14855 [Verrucomicrobia bacterium]|nr:hypothetical protein [Verrucomicrobiota bacterium]